MQLATSVLSDINHEQSQKQTAVENVVHALKVSLEETEMRMSDLRKDAFAFKRDVVMKETNGKPLEEEGSNNKGNSSSRKMATKTSCCSGVSNLDRVLRYYHSKLQVLDSTMDRLRLQKAYQRNKVQKMEAQLKQKEKAGNSFHYIDFHQLQIENKKLEEEVDEKTIFLGALKCSEENSHNKLVALKNKVQQQQKKNSEVKRAVELRQKHLKRVEVEISTIKAELEKKRFMEEKEGDYPSSSDYKVDDRDIMEMVKLQANLFELRDKIKVWERKVEIAKVTLENRKKNTKSIR